MIPELSFLHPERAHLLWVVLLFGALLVWLELRSRDALTRFMSLAMQLRLAERPSPARRWVQIGLVIAMLTLGALALMRPQTRKAPEAVELSGASADIMVVLDVSKSMLAEDAAPNRLDRAKAEVNELLSNLHGHRVGLVAFAGRAAVLCPMTPDYGFFRMSLRSVGTRSVSRGGTKIGEAIRKAVEAFPPGEGSKLILLITDGEDHESYPKDAAKLALEAGIRIVAIGFGSEEGSEIRITDPETGAKTLLTDKSGQVVKSRLDGVLLREVALATEGAYIPAGVAALDLESIVSSHIRPLVGAQKRSSMRVIQGEQYPWFVLGAMLALFGAVWTGATGERRRLT